ncbi:MAG: fumarate hydratase [Gammaproteobacteria bacterium]|nr:fumarate hydratase [Gammaproteobacteria bacterium]
MTRIKRQDFVDSIADAFQYISAYHPADFIRAMAQAYEREINPAAKNAIAQILTSARMAALAKRPVCQDTGIAVVFLKIGMQVQWDSDESLQSMVDAAVSKAYTDEHNPLRASVLSDPAGARRNTGDNTPAVVHVELVAGDNVEVIVAAKGGGSENKAKFAILNPSDSLVDWVLAQVENMGAGWCPPGILGVGIGGTPEKALLLAKESLMAPLDMPELQARGAQSRTEELRLELFDKINALGIGAQGLGGITTVLDVKVLDYPTHAASLPVAIIPNCAATRHAHFTLDGSGPVYLQPPALDDWPEDILAVGDATRRVDLDTLTPADTRTWKAGDTLLLSGKMLTGRDAAHKRIQDMLARGESLPVDFHGRVIYYVGPVDAVGDEVVGPAGPTTATRMDKFTDMMLGEQVGVIGMVGKAERGPAAVESIKNHQAVYLIATGGAAYLVSKAIKGARVVGFEDLGMEAIHEFDLQDMPVTVAVDSEGNSIHTTGPAQMRVRIETMRVA